jgi:hypothetical protein
MNNLSDDQIWSEIQARLKKMPQPVLNTEIFTNKVMARLSEPKPSSLLGWSKPWWTIPALAFGSWMVLFLGARMDDTLVGTQSLLLTGSSSEQAQQLLYQPEVAADDIFNLLLEDNQL